MDSLIFITSYQRPQLLLRLLKEIEGRNVVVIDDGSYYNPAEHKKYCQYYRTKHVGKQGFWIIWNYMLARARNCNANEFIFMQDDLYDIDIKGLLSIEFPDKYAFNLMDVGPDRGWSPLGYVDCNFMTNRASLDAIDWKIPPVPECRWDNNPNLSSGVGDHLSKAFYNNNIPMYLPSRNYASHGDNESIMHGELRKREPLIAKTGQ